MIEIIRLKDGKGSNKFGSCSSCGDYGDSDEFIRIRFTHDNSGISICLCPTCKRLLLDKLEEKGGGSNA